MGALGALDRSSATKHRRPTKASAGVGITALLALLLVWSSHSRTWGDVDSAAEQSAGAAGPDLAAALQRRECPARDGGGAVSIAFLHIPKTAGNFLVKLMKHAMPEKGIGRFCVKRQDYVNHANFPCLEKTGLAPEHLQLLADLRANFTRVCSGFNVHQDYGFFQALGVDHARTLTMVALRHPVERALSHYYFQMRIRADRPSSFPFWPKNDSDYSGLVAFGSQQRQQANYHTYMLAGALGCQWPGGPVPPTSDAAILERAKRNLERFCVILIMEYMDESLQLLGEAAGWPDEVLLGTIEPSNATPRPKVPLEVKRALQAANHLDMQLYEYAVQLFLRRSRPPVAAVGDG